jgi:16S rRNA (cytosine1402-N4)-methyltransferase
MMDQGKYHVPVLLNEALEALKIKPSGIYVDCTFGGGSHGKMILEKLREGGKLIAFDQDDDARQNLPPDERIIFISANFRHLTRFLRLHQIAKVDGLLADLGISSHQIDTPDRGFSTRYDGPLDMRMNTKADKKATNVIESYSKEALHKIFEQYGEVTNSKTLATAIVDIRSSRKITTVSEFKNAIYSLVKGNPEKYFAKVFQALRIEVNDELGALRELLEQIPQVLEPGGRAAIITFHSLEDRLVKNFFKHGAVEKKEDTSIYGLQPPREMKVITNKPIVPTGTEISENSRARSAKLRVAEKV